MAAQPCRYCTLRAVTVRMTLDMLIADFSHGKSNICGSESGHMFEKLVFEIGCDLVGR